MAPGVLNTMVQHLSLYLTYWWNRVNFSSARITFDKLYILWEVAPEWSILNSITKASSRATFFTVIKVLIIKTILFIVKEKIFFESSHQEFLISQTTSMREFEMNAEMYACEFGALVQFVGLLIRGKKTAAAFQETCRASLAQCCWQKLTNTCLCLFTLRKPHSLLILNGE